MDDKKKGTVKHDRTAVWLVVGALFMFLLVGVLISMLKDISDQQRELIKLQEELGKEQTVSVTPAVNVPQTPAEQAAPVEETVKPELITANTETYTCVARNEARCYTAPDTTAAVICKYKSSDKVDVIELSDGFYKVKVYDHTVGYMQKRYLSQAGALVNIPNAVDLRAYLPNAEFKIKNATTNNITGHVLYPAIPILEEETAKLLKQAAEIFEKDGYAIVIYDAYRPHSAQVELWEIVQTTAFIANPYKGGSWHQRGRAVDMSLMDIETGEELEMPSPMHTFDYSSSRGNWKNWTETAKKNSDYMTDVMTSVGFKTISTEWWHFEYTRAGNMLSGDIDLSSAEYR